MARQPPTRSPASMAQGARPVDVAVNKPRWRRFTLPWRSCCLSPSTLWPPTMSLMTTGMLLVICSSITMAVAAGASSFHDADKGAVRPSGTPGRDVMPYWHVTVPSHALPCAGRQIFSRDPVDIIPAANYSVCNVRNSTYQATLEAYRDHAGRCSRQHESVRQCLLTRFDCCEDPFLINGTILQMQCSLDFGLCTVFDTAPDRRKELIGAWKSTQCAWERGGEVNPDLCQCLKMTAQDGDFPFPTPCVLVYPSTGLLDPVTKTSTVTTTSFGPYPVRRLTQPRPRKVTRPGREPRACVPISRTSVRACDEAGRSRIEAVTRSCRPSLEPAEKLVDGSPGDCCSLPLDGTTSVVYCIIGSDCVRIDGSTASYVLGDVAAAPGCVGGGGEVQPPGVATSTVCRCVPRTPPPPGGCAYPHELRQAPPPVAGECMVINSARGGIGTTGVPFSPVLDVCPK